MSVSAIDGHVQAAVLAGAGMPAARMVRAGRVDLFVLADGEAQDDRRLHVHIGFLVVATAAPDDRVACAVERALSAPDIATLTA